MAHNQRDTFDMPSVPDEDSLMSDGWDASEAESWDAAEDIGHTCPGCGSAFARIIAPLGRLVHACCRNCGLWYVVDA